MNRLKKMKMDHKIKGEKNIKLKVLISYALMVLLIAFILNFSFSSFRTLTQSSDALAQPNARINLLHEMIFSLYHAESQIRSYSLNNQQVYLDAYFDELMKINVMVDSLNILAGDDVFFLQTIDSINIQLLHKTKLLEQFIQLKKHDPNFLFYREAINEIIQVTEQEPRVREVTHQSILSQVPPYNPDHKDEDSSGSEGSEPPAMEISEMSARRIQQEKTNFLTRMKTLFYGPRNEVLQITEQPPMPRQDQVQELVQQIRTDSIITLYRDTESLKEDLEKAMVNLMQSMLKSQQNLRNMETSILMEDKTVMDRIWNYVTVLQDYETSHAMQKAENAHATVNTTTEKIFATVVFSLLVLLVFALLLISDVNKSKFYKNQLIRQKSRAEQLVQIKQRFMANISHEIRTPLNSIIGFSSQLEKSNLQHDVKPFVEAINQSSVHLRDIVNDILDFSKIEAGKIDLEIRPMNLREVLEEVYNTLSIIALEKKLEFRIDTKDLQHPYLLGDPLRIKQVLLNITGNAIKFTHKGSVLIMVSDYMKKDNPQMNYVHIRIADTGIGISSSDQESIFEEFAQGDNQNTRKHGGTGLGLSISKKLVEIMNGNIELLSQLGRGTTFSVHLPLILSSEPSSSLQNAQLNIPFDTVAKILLIDDDELNRLLLKTLFSPMKGISFYEAEDAMKGLALLNEQKFDLVITDIHMPGVSGLEMIRQLRKNPEALNMRTCVIACTADITPETIRQIHESGIQDYLLKPIDEQQLVRKINYHLLSGDNFQPTLNEPLQQTTVYHIKQKPYDLQGLMAFTGEDPKAVVPVIEVFINDTRTNLEKLQESLREDNRQEIFRLAHKMDNMFGLLKAEEAIFYLKKLNTLKDNNGISRQEILESVASIIQISNYMIQLLDYDLKAINSGEYPEN